VKTCTVVGPAAPPKGASSAVLVQVMDIDETILGKAVQQHTFEVIPIDGFPDAPTAVAAQYPGWNIYASADDLRTAVTQLLVMAGLRQVDPISGAVQLTPLAIAIDAGTAVAQGPVTAAPDAPVNAAPSP
jgi:hypothetical protein